MQISDAKQMLERELNIVKGEFEAYHFARTSNASLENIDKKIHEMKFGPEDPYTASFLLGLRSAKKIIQEAGNSTGSFKPSIQYPTKAEFDLYWKAQPLAGKIDGLSFAISNPQSEAIAKEIQRIGNLVDGSEVYKTKNSPGVYQEGYLSGLNKAQAVLSTIKE